MELLIKDRASGKTTGLVYASEATGYPICVSTLSRIETIITTALELGCIIPQPVTVAELKSGYFKGSSIKNVLFDEVSEILGDAVNNYLGINVVGATMSDYRKETQNYKLKAKQRGEHYERNN